MDTSIAAVAAFNSEVAIPENDPFDTSFVLGPKRVTIFTYFSLIPLIVYFKFLVCQLRMLNLEQNIINILLKQCMRCNYCTDCTNCN